MPRLSTWLLARSPIRFHCVLVLALACAAPASPQQTPQPATTPPANPSPVPLVPRSHDEREDRFRARHRIILNVQVADASGNAAANLKPGNFTLLVDRQPHPLVEIRPVTQATGLARVNVILLLDALNTTSAELDAERKAVEAYLSQAQTPLDIPPSASSAELHSIELHLSNPALTARTTTLYYAEP